MERLGLLLCMLSAVFVIACTERVVVETGTMPPPKGAIEFCERNPHKDICK